jgi:hypothetical protein
VAGTAAQASAEEVTELMADDRSIPTTCSPYAGELPARDKIADVYTPGYLQATERHLRFATARLGLRLPPGATILDTRARRLSLLVGLRTRTCNYARARRMPAGVDCRSRSGGPSSATPFASPARSMIGVTPATGAGRTARRCAGVFAVSWTRRATALGALEDVVDRGCGG